MNDSPVDCQNVKLPTATFVTRVEARPSASRQKRTHIANKDGRTQFAPTTHLRFTVGRCLGAAENEGIFVCKTQPVGATCGRPKTNEFQFAPIQPVGATIGRPQTSGYRVQGRAIRESPLRKSLKSSVGDDVAKRRERNE